MNHIYRSVWNEALGTWVAVSEITKGQGKRAANRRKLLATSLLICSTPTWALPTGDQLVAGQATVSTTNAGQMQINQASQKAVINWQGFSVAPNEAVNIQQPNANAALLNRVVGQDASQIQGQIKANGQVYIVNPNGVMFSKTAQVDVGGLVATTHNVSNQDFMNGNNHFTQNGATGTVENHGTINAKEGGVVALIGEKVTNTGLINTPKGTTALAAGKTVDLDFQGDGLVEVKVTEAALNAQITNQGAIQADGGRVIMTAKAANQLIDTVINQEGIVKARGLVERNGEIILDGGDNGITRVSGTLNASGNGVGEKGGKVVVTGNKVLIDSTAKLNATGATGGGDILVGGSWQNSDTSIRQATATVVKQGAVLDASATDTGKGGTVVAWSNIHDPHSATRAWGTFLAKGGVNGGDGGRIETSGHWLNTDSIKVDTTAQHGQTGLWLLDPFDIAIVNSDANGAYDGTNTWTPSASGSTVSASNIATLLNSSNVTIQTTGGGGTEAGNIRVSTAIDASTTAPTTLELDAIGSIFMNQQIKFLGGNGIILKAGGSILDNHTGSADIITNNLDITTGTGMSVDMEVNQLKTVNNSTVNGSALRNLSTVPLTVLSLSDASVGTGISGIQLSSLGSIYVSGNIQAAGNMDLAANGGDFMLFNNATITNTSSADSNLLIKATGNILFNFLNTITSPNGKLNISLKSDSDASNGGAIYSQFTTINSNGGTITFSGGVNGTGYAQGDDFHLTGIELNYITLNSGGGNIYMRGKSSQGLGGCGGGLCDGVYISGDSFIDSGTGTISIEGIAQGQDPNFSSNGIEIDGQGNSITIRSANTTTNAIGLTGTAAVANGVPSGYGILIQNSFGEGPAESTISATGGGGITLIGNSNKNAGVHIDTYANILANSGRILLDGTTTGSTNSAVESTGILGQQVGSLVPTSSSNINIIADSLNLATSSLIDTPQASNRIISSGILTISPKTTNRSMTVQAGAGNNSQLYVDTSLFGAGLPISTNFSKLVFGSPTTGVMNVSGLNFNSTYSVDLLTGNNLTLGGATTTVKGANKVLTIDVTGGGTVTSPSVLDVSNLLLKGTNSNFFLDNSLNTIDTVAAVLGSGSLSLKNNKTLTIGAMNGVNGIDPTGTGTVTIEALGATSDLILDQPVVTADGNIVLAAGRDFINNVLPLNSGIVITGTGQYFVYSSNPTNSLEGMLNYNKHYNQTYTSGIIPSYASAGNWFFYTIAPQLLVAPDLKTITYSNLDAYTPNYTGFIDGDTATTAGITGTALFDTLGTTSTSGNFIVGLHEVVYNSGLLSSLGYTFADNGRSLNELTVTPLTLLVQGINANDKVYDTTTNATLNGTAFVTPITSDIVNLDGAGSVSFVSPNAGTNNVLLSGYSISGIDASNYLLQLPSLIANITPATLIYTADLSSRVYGSVNPTFSGTVTGFVGADTLASATTGTAQFTSLANNLSNVGNYAIDGSGLIANHGNYIFTQAASNATALRITPAALSITANADSKTFDGLAYFGGNGVSYSGFVNGETSAVLSGILNYTGSSQGAINIGDYTITPFGLSTGNYNISYVNGNLRINPAQLVVNRFSPVEVSTPIGEPTLVVNNDVPLIDQAVQENIAGLITSLKSNNPIITFDAPTVSSDLSVNDITNVFAGNEQSSQPCDDSDEESKNPLLHCRKRVEESTYTVLPVLQVKNSSGRVKHLEMSANKKFISLLFEDGSVRVWDFQSGIQRQVVAPNKTQTFTDIGTVNDQGESLPIASKVSIDIHDIISALADEKSAINEPDISRFASSDDGSLLLVDFGTNELSLWDNKQNKKRWQLPYQRGTVRNLAIANNKHYGAVLSHQLGAYVMPVDLQLKSITDAVDIVDLDTGKIIKSLPNMGEQVVSMRFKDNDTLSIGLTSGELLDWHIPSNSQKTVANFAETLTAIDSINDTYVYLLKDGTARIGDAQGHIRLSIRNKGNTFQDVRLLEDGKKLLTVLDNGELALWDVASGKKMLRLFSTLQGWTVMDAFGRFDSSEDAIDNFTWLANEEEIPLDSFSENYYEPGLLSNVLQNQDYLNNDPDMVQDGISLPPKINFQLAEQQAKGDTVAVQLDVYDRGGGIDKIKIYHNGKLISLDNLVVGDQSQQENNTEHRALTLNVTPSAGKNTLKVVVSNDMGIENSSSELSFDGKTKAYTSSLRLLTVGIDKYSDADLNLDYSVADANSIVQAIKTGAKTTVNKHLINENATKPKILAELRELSQGTQQDVLVVYFAGHGLALGKEWYFLPYETTLQPTPEKIAATGITATELSDIFKNSKIQHIMLMVDSCYAGAGMGAFSKLQNGQRYFTRQLSRTLGITVVTSTTKDQEASELKSLGHGLFTYLITQELEKKEATSSTTAHGVAESIVKTLPVFSKKILGSSQNPAVYKNGSDFMLTDIVNDTK